MQSASATNRTASGFAHARRHHGSYCKRFVEVGLYVVHAFVKLNEFLSSQKLLTKQPTNLERRVGHDDNSLTVIIAALRSIMESPAPAK